MSINFVVNCHFKKIALLGLTHFFGTVSFRKLIEGKSSRSGNESFLTYSISGDGGTCTYISLIVVSHKIPCDHFFYCSKIVADF